MFLRKPQAGRSASSCARGARLRLETLEERMVLSSSPTTPLVAPTSLAVRATSYSSTDILVQYRTNQPETHLAGTTLGPKLSLVTNLYEINLSPAVTVGQALTAYSAAPDVVSAQPDYTLSTSAVPSSPNFNQQWALQNTGQGGGTTGADIGATQAWNVTTGSNRVIVAVADTGVDFTHPDLYQNIWINQEAIPASRLKNLVDVYHDGFISMRDLNSPVNQGPGKIEDLDHNGYIDAGDLLQPMKLNAKGQDSGLGGWINPNAGDSGDGFTNDLIGWNFSANNNDPYDDNGHGTHVSGIIAGTGNDGGTLGVAPNVLLMPVKFLDANGQGSISQYIQGLDYAVEHGAKIVNNSWTGADPSQALTDAIANAQANGVIFVAAAGNGASNNDANAVYPANYSTTLNNVVTVAASDDNNHLAGFSNFGGRSVSLAAPGVDILSTLPGGVYGTMSGTSMATPMVSGTLALVWSEHPTWNYSQVIAQVLNTTTKESGLQNKTATAGVLNAASAVGALPAVQGVQASSTPPRVVSATESGPTANCISCIQVTFDRSIAASSFTTASVGLLAPGQRVAIASVKAVPGLGNRTYDILFTNQTAAGTYTLTIGASVRDLAGAPATPYYTQFLIAAPKPAKVVPPVVTAPPGPHVVSVIAKGAAKGLSMVALTFDRAIVASSFTASNLTLLVGGKQILIAAVKAAPGSGNCTFDIFFTQPAVGTDTLYVGSSVTDLLGRHLAAYHTQFVIAMR